MSKTHLIERLTGQVTEIGDYRNDYGTRMDPWELVLPMLHDVGAAAIIARGIPRATAYSTLKGVRSRAHYDTYLAIAREHAVHSLRGRGVGAAG